MITTNSLGRRIAKTDTQIAAFWRWFGNSKVVDAQGRPLVVYHGTRREFDTFLPRAPRGARGNKAGVYFSPVQRDAHEYAMDVDGAFDEQARVRAVYLRIESLKDGEIIDHSYRGREYVVFDSKNIKSARGNRGTFDPESPLFRNPMKKNPYFLVGKYLVYSREVPEGGHKVKLFKETGQFWDDRHPRRPTFYKDPNALAKKYHPNPRKRK